MWFKTFLLTCLQSFCAEWLPTKQPFFNERMASLLSENVCMYALPVITIGVAISNSWSSPLTPREKPANIYNGWMRGKGEESLATRSLCQVRVRTASKCPSSHGKGEVGNLEGIIIYERVKHAGNSILMVDRVIVQHYTSKDGPLQLALLEGDHMIICSGKIVLVSV